MSVEHGETPDVQMYAGEHLSDENKLAAILGKVSIEDEAFMAQLRDRIALNERYGLVEKKQEATRAFMGRSVIDVALPTAEDYVRTASLNRQHRWSQLGAPQYWS